MKRTIYFDDDLWRALEKAARQIGKEERRSVSVSELLRQAAAEWLDSLEEAKDDAARAAGRAYR